MIDFSSRNAAFEYDSDLNLDRSDNDDQKWLLYFIAENLKRTYELDT